MILMCFWQTNHMTSATSLYLIAIQVQGAPGHVAQYRGAVHCLKCILREEGPGAFYRGTLSSYLKVCPSIAVTYGLYAFIIQLWGIGGLRSALILARLRLVEVTPKY